MINTTDKFWRMKLGQAGVHQVASQLLLRGLNVSFPAVDCGVDLIVENNVRVQVKSTRKSSRMPDNYPNGAYWFHFTKNTRKEQFARIRGDKMSIPHPFSEICDVVVLWGIDQNRFWIVPAHELDGRFLVAIGSQTTYRKAVRPDDVAPLRKAGLTYEQIATELGFSRQTISRKDNFRNVAVSCSSIVAGYENRWDVIATQVQDYQEEIVEEGTAIEVKTEVKEEV